MAAPIPSDSDAPPVRQIVATPGSPFGIGAARRRAIGRIAGVVGLDTGRTAAAQRALGAALGPAVRLLDPATRPIVVDFDACSIEGVALSDDADWARIAREDRWGEVRGAFAAAWFDADGSLQMARDPLGERTIVWSEVDGGGIVFTSGSLRALLATGLVARRVDLRAVADYLSYAYLPGETTLVETVRELLPGEILRFDRGTTARRRFWSLPAEPSADPPPDEKRQRLELRARLETAVRRRLPKGKPVGAFLSGGLDSSLVVALARRLHDHPVVTWSIHFGRGSANELEWSSLVARHCRTEHRVVELTPEAILARLDDSISLLSDPIGDPLTVPNALLFREASAEVGAVLNGEGGDPCFGGPKNLPMLLAELYGHGGHGPIDDGRWARERSYLRAHQKCFDDLAAMLAPGPLEAMTASPLESALGPHFDDPRFRHFVTKLQAMNVSFKGGHHILPKVDALSAPFGVVPRSPLFDRDVVELAFALRPQAKLRGSVEKWLLKRAVEDLLPTGIVERPKSGMLVPVEAWFSGPLLPVARERLLDGLASWDLVRRDWMERLLDGRLGGLRPRRGAKIWLLVTLESWLRQVVGR